MGSTSVCWVGLTWGMGSRSRVELFESIRRARRDEGLSVRELSRRFGVHRRTVREALESPWPAPRKTPEREAPVLGQFKPIIDAWLVADQAAPRKQRLGGCGSAWLMSTVLGWLSRRSASTWLTPGVGWASSRRR